MRPFRPPRSRTRNPLSCGQAHFSLALSGFVSVFYFSEVCWPPVLAWVSLGWSRSGFVRVNLGISVSGSRCPATGSHTVLDVSRLGFMDDTDGQTPEPGVKEIGVPGEPGLVDSLGGWDSTKDGPSPRKRWFCSQRRWARTVASSLSSGSPAACAPTVLHAVLPMRAVGWRAGQSPSVPAGCVLSLEEQRQEGRWQIHRRDQAVVGVKIKMGPGGEEEELRAGEQAGDQGRLP